MTFAKEQEHNLLDEKIKALLREPDRNFTAYNWSEIEVLLRPESKPVLTLSTKKVLPIVLGILVLTLLIWAINSLEIGSDSSSEDTPEIKSQYVPPPSEFQFDAHTKEQAKELVIPMEDEAEPTVTPAKILEPARDSVKALAIPLAADTQQKIIPAQVSPKVKTEKPKAKKDSAKNKPAESVDDGFEPYQFNAPAPASDSSSGTGTSPKQ